MAGLLALGTAVTNNPSLPAEEASTPYGHYDRPSYRLAYICTITFLSPCVCQRSELESNSFKSIVLATEQHSVCSYCTYCGSAILKTWPHYFGSQAFFRLTSCITVDAPNMARKT